MQPTNINRRDFLSAGAAAAFALGSTLNAQAPTSVTRPKLKAKFKQGCMRTNFDPKMSMEDCVKIAASLGIQGFDMAAQTDWPMMRKYGVEPSMAGAGPVGFEDGVIRKEQHDALEKAMHAYIDAVAKDNCKNIICVGGKRKGMSYEEGADNAVAFFNRIKAHMEDKQITLCLEMMNNKYDDARLGRTDQICNHFSWGAGVMQRVNSPRMKMLFDIYHVGTADGDVIANLKAYYPFIAHFHTGGVPGRNELDNTQELNYPLIAKTIADLGFTGFITHEYRPAAGKNPMESLKQSIAIMDVV
jgi:hydroxypyruvate isomerase